MALDPLKFTVFRYCFNAAAETSSRSGESPQSTIKSPPRPTKTLCVGSIPRRAPWREIETRNSAAQRQSSIAPGCLYTPRIFSLSAVYVRRH